MTTSDDVLSRGTTLMEIKGRGKKKDSKPILCFPPFFFFRQDLLSALFRLERLKPVAYLLLSSSLMLFTSCSSSL